VDDVVSGAVENPVLITELDDDVGEIPGVRTDLSSVSGRNQSPAGCSRQCCALGRDALAVRNRDESARFVGDVESSAEVDR
jgi:hypothetical protein